MDLREQLNIHGTTGEALKHWLAEIPLTELLNGWDSLTPQEELQIFMGLDLETKADLITELSYSQQETLITSLSAQNARQLLAELEPDDLTDFLQAVSPEVRKSVWNNMSEESRKESLFLLRFDEDDAAGLMTPRYLAVRAAVTVSQALNFVRRNAKAVEIVYSLYVVDELQRLQGVVDLKTLLSADDSQTVRQIMDTHYISVREDTDQEEAARILETYDLVSLPVLDSHNRLLGLITFDDIIDVIREEHTEDTYKMVAMQGKAERYLDTSVWGQVKKRVPWLIILLLLGTITTSVLDHYEQSILGAAFLILFIPVITQTGGNSGSQSATLMIRGLATEEIHTRDVMKVMLKEIAVGLLMGAITGAVIIARTILLPPGVGIYPALVIGASLSFVVLFSTVIGALAPIVISRLGFDPTVMSTPLMSTVIDVCGLTIYFETARLFLNL